MVEPLPKKVIITGATDGIGLRLAWLFSQQDCQLLLTGRKNKNELPYPLPEFACYIKADQSDSQCAAIIKKQVIKMGWSHIDNLVLNAATGFATNAANESRDKIITTMRVNMEAPIVLVHQLANFLISTNTPRSTITFIGSTAKKGAAGFASYAASKAGISGFVRALASEWCDLADVQILHPAPTNTQMQEKAGLQVGAMRKYFVDPDYSARRILQLISTAKPQAKIGVVSFGVHRVKQKLGLAAKSGKIIQS